MALASSILVQLSALALVIYAVLRLLRRSSLAGQLSWVPGPPALPVLGNLFNFCFSSQQDMFKKLMVFKKKYGNIYKIWLGSTPIILCQDLELVQKIFKNEEKVIRNDLYSVAANMMGNGIATMQTGDKWKLHHKSLSNSFNTDIYENVSQQTWEKSLAFVAFLMNFVKNGESLDLVEHAERLSYDLIIATATGLKYNSLEGEDSKEFLEIFESFATICMVRTLFPPLKSKFIYNLTPFRNMELDIIAKLDRIAVEVIQRRKEILNNQAKEEGQENHSKQKQKRIPLDNLIELNKSNPRDFPDEEVVNDIKNIILAGYASLGSSVSFTLFLLGNHPEYQQKLVEELDIHVPNILTTGITLQDISKLELLDRCIKEALRMFPPAHMLCRRVISPIEMTKGIIPAGVDVYINMFAYHRNEELYIEPDKFNPDRFLPSELNKRDPLSFVPFSAGVRICIGQKQALIQAKIIISLVLKKYYVIPLEKIEDLAIVGNLTIKSKTGLRVKLTER